jgi:hypothetical protein
LGEKSPRRRSTGRTGVVELIGRLLGFRDSRAGGEDAVQGNAAASGGQRGGHGGRRGLRRPLPRAPHGASRGRWQGERDRRADRRVPVGRETRGGRWAGG